MTNSKEVTGIQPQNSGVEPQSTELEPPRITTCYLAVTSSVVKLFHAAGGALWLA